MAKERKVIEIEESLAEMLAASGVPPESFDLLLYGDGSGRHGMATGFGCWSYDRETNEEGWWHGGLNAGTTNLAEALAYLPALEFYANRELARRKKHAPRAVRVAVVTDSAYVQCVGADRKLGPIPNSGAWHLMNAYRSVGFVMTFYHINRNDTQANRVADALANKGRLLAAAFADANEEA